MKNAYTFSAKIWKWPAVSRQSAHAQRRGDMGWHFVSLPKELFTEIRNTKGKGMIPIRVTVGETTWQTSLFPHVKSSSYLISIKQSVRKQENLWPGEQIAVQFEVL